MVDVIQPAIAAGEADVATDGVISRYDDKGFEPTLHLGC